MTAQKITAPGLAITSASNPFVLKILPVTRFDSRFCRDEGGSVKAIPFISRILRERYIKNIFAHFASLRVEPLPLPLCVE